MKHLAVYVANDTKVFCSCMYDEYLYALCKVENPCITSPFGNVKLHAALLKQKYVIHTFLVWFSSLHRAYHFLVCYAYYRYVIHTQNGMKCTL